jgi:hypothetical protein
MTNLDPENYDSDKEPDIVARNYFELNKKLNSIGHSSQLTEVSYTELSKPQLIFRPIIGWSVIKIRFWRTAYNIANNLANIFDTKYSKAVVFASRGPAQKSQYLSFDYEPCAMDRAEDLEIGLNPEECIHKHNGAYPQPT